MTAALRNHPPLFRLSSDTTLTFPSINPSIPPSIHPEMHQILPNSMGGS